MMTSYQFDGVFRDTSWQGLPSPEEVKVSIERAIRGATPQVFAIEIDRIDVTSLNADLPAAMPHGWPSADVIVNWEVTDGD